MAEQTTLNTDLEQALYKATLRERALRQRATLFVAIPIVLGAIWLLYSASQVSAWHQESKQVQDREAALEKREADAKRQVEEVRAQRDKAQERVAALEAEQKKERARAEDIQQLLGKARAETASLGVLLNDLNSARAKASKLMSSEPVENQLAEIRTTLARGLGRIGQQMDMALPAGGQKAYVYVYTADDTPRGLAAQLKSALESNGFEVAGTVKNSTRRVDATEVRYFREPADKAEAARIAAILEKQTGQTNVRVISGPDPDHLNEARKFQIWLGKAPSAGTR